MLWQQMKGILSLQLVHDVRESKNYWKVLGQRVQPKSQWTRAGHLCTSYSEPTNFLFVSILGNTTENNWTDRNSQPGMILLVHLRVQLSCRVLTLTLGLKGCVLTSMTSCYQPSFEPTIQLTNFFMIYCVFCSHTLFGLLWSHAGWSAFRFIWKLMKLCRVEVVSPTVLHSKKVLTICSRHDHCHLEWIMQIWLCGSLLGRIWLAVGRQARNSRGNRPAVVLVSWQVWFTSCQFMDTFMEFALEK